LSHRQPSPPPMPRRRCLCLSLSSVPVGPPLDLAGGGRRTTPKQWFATCHPRCGWGGLQATHSHPVAPPRGRRRVREGERLWAATILRAAARLLNGLCGGIIKYFVLILFSCSKLICHSFSSWQKKNPHFLPQPY
jgi:hypothetical protein